MKSRTFFWWCSFTALVLIGGIYLYWNFSVPKVVVPAAASPLPIIRIAHDHWPGYAAADIAQGSKYCASEGIRCLVTITDDYDDIVSGLKSGKYDIAAGLSTAYFDIANDDRTSNFKIILATDQSLGSDGIVSRAGALPLSKNTHPVFATDYIYGFLIGEVMKRYNRDISSARFATSTVTEDVALQLLREKRADYHATYEPYLSQAKKEGMRIEYTSDEDPGIITDVFVASGKALTEKKNLLRTFSRAYFHALGDIKNSPERAEREISNSFKISQESLHDQLGHVHFLDLEANLRAMQTAFGYGSLPNILRAAALTRAKRGLEVRRDAESMIDRSIITQ